MTFYMHIDRSGKLPLNKTIELVPCRGESRISNFAGMFTDGFAEHIEKLCSEGLSYHGLTYLIYFLRREAKYPLVFNELFLEFVRWKYDLDVPSRFQSFFAFENERDAREFLRLMRKEDGTKRIVEVEALGNVERFDMNLSRRISGDMEGLALAYWNSERLSNDASYTPFWEYLLELPVRVIREIYSEANI